MKLESPTAVVKKSKEETFEYLNNVENFKNLMPESAEKFEIIGPDTFLFSLKGMPEIALKKTAAIPYDRIVLEAAGGKINFSLTADLNEMGPAETAVQLHFTGDFNPMMAMMVKKPISKFIETLATNLPRAAEA